MSLQTRQTINPPSQDSDVNASYMGSLTRPSCHVTSIARNYTTLGTPITAYFPCNFPVREIIIRANSSIYTTAPDSFYALSNCPAFAGGEIVMGFNGSVTYNSTANTYNTISSFNQNTMRYLLRQPMLLQGNWSWQLMAVDNTPVIANVVIDFELLG